VDVTGLDANLGAHRLQALDVLINRARANRTASRKRDFCLTEARQQRSQHQDRGAHGFHHLIRRFQLGDIAPTQLKRRALFLNREAHLT
jgi:hypothetical protein